MSENTESVESRTTPPQSALETGTPLLAEQAALKKAHAKYFPEEKIRSMVEGFIKEVPDGESAEAALSNQVSTELGKFLSPDEVTLSMQHVDKSIRDRGQAPLISAAVASLQEITANPTVIKAYESHLRKEFLAGEGFIPLSEILSYHVTKDIEHVFLHLAPARTLTEQERNTAILDGMAELARRLAEEEILAKVKKVNATSWLVAQRPDEFSALGFTLEGPVDEEIRRAHFSHDERPIHKSSIEKGDFIKRYLRDEK